MKYSCFLDETGDHGLSFVDKNFPLFLLCGFVIQDERLVAIEKKVNRLKCTYFGEAEVILHSREIRKCEGAFQVLFDLPLKEKFYEDLNSILKEGSYCLIGSGIQKEEHIKKYGKGAKDPYALSLSFVLERLVFYLDSVEDEASVEVLAEERGRREDRMLLSHFNSVLDLGTFYVEPQRLRKRVRGLSFHAKRDNVVGLQLADLCAYPLARHILNPREPYIPFKIIEPKIYCAEGGRYEGWGLKVFP